MAGRRCLVRRERAADHRRVGACGIGRRGGHVGAYGRSASARVPDTRSATIADPAGLLRQAARRFAHLAEGLGWRRVHNRPFGRRVLDRTRRGEVGTVAVDPACEHQRRVRRRRRDCLADGRTGWRDRDGIVGGTRGHSVSVLSPATSWPSSVTSRRWTAAAPLFRACLAGATSRSCASAYVGCWRWTVARPVTRPLGPCGSTTWPSRPTKRGSCQVPRDDANVSRDVTGGGGAPLAAAGARRARRHGAWSAGRRSRHLGRPPARPPPHRSRPCSTRRFSAAISATKRCRSPCSRSSRASRCQWKWYAT